MKSLLILFTPMQYKTIIILSHSTNKPYFIDLPIIDIGFLANLRRPQKPMYLLRHPADHIRIKYSTPKNTTRTVS